MKFIFIFIISYLLGCIPWAYIFLKFIEGKDIREIGTGNVGAMNSYEITNKRWLGFTVMLMDASKGIVAVIISYLIDTGSMACVSIAGISVVFGHNYNIFLKFKGGRGLATSSGVFLFLNPLFILSWLNIWMLSYFFIKKNFHIDNAIATIMTFVVYLIIPENLFIKFNLLFVANKAQFGLLISIISCLILLRHIEPLQIYFDENLSKN